MPTRKWGTEKLVNIGLTGNQGNSSVAALAGGGFVVVWQDDAATDSVIRGQRYDAAGAKAGAEIFISSFTGDLGDQTEPSVTGLADGGFYVGWTDFDSATDHDITGAVFNAAGGFVRSQFSEGSGLDTETANVARLGAGSVSAWEFPDGDGTGIQFRIFDAVGTGGAVLQANIATTAFQQHPSVAAAPDASKFAIVWDSNFDSTIKGRLFNAAGAEFAPEFFIASAGGALGVADPVVTWLSNGTFAVAWRELNLFNAGGNQIRVKIFDGQSATVNALTGNILVNSTLFDSQQDPEITALPNGGFVVAWEDFSEVGGDSSQSAIRLQAFDGAGGKIGGEMLVNTTTAQGQFDASIAALADGRIAVSWTDTSSGNGDIRMQIVDPRDGIVTGTAAGESLLGHDAVGDEVNGLDGADTCFGLAGNDQIYGGQGNDIADGGKGDDSLFGGTDIDLLVGGLGDDDLFGEDGNDTLRGGAGADTMDGGAGAADLVDYLTVTSGGITAALDASLAGTGEAFGDTFAGIERLRGTNFNDTLRGDAAANIIWGMTGADTQQGLAGADRLIGGLGIDTLTGGTQADRFEYAALTEIGDLILDFTAVDDTIAVTGAAFGGGLIAGTLGAALFQSSATNVAANATVRFIFENDVKILWFDADGNGAGAAVMVADLQASATMTNADILVV